MTCDPSSSIRARWYCIPTVMFNNARTTVAPDSQTKPAHREVSGKQRPEGRQPRNSTISRLPSLRYGVINGMRPSPLPKNTGWSKKDGSICFLCHKKPVKGFAYYYKNMCLISREFLWHKFKYCEWRCTAVRDHKTKYPFFPPVHSFVKNLHCADFELHVNPGDANSNICLDYLA